MESLEGKGYTEVDFITKTNRAWEGLRNPCKHNRGLDGGFRFLCSSANNTSKVNQNARLEKRCALPWCPHAQDVAIVASGKASWMKQM